ncbi:hypothetical protein [uncultured Draconibacterium sp.]|uniref:hypothetical protein n=1 Tax=uncultured Draconibacterium sp. TaxID=1573823 RepID=UPI0025E5C6C1|nr:hypothetical protein [uncultured Draconibacterium sp.]
MTKGIFIFLFIITFFINTSAQKDTLSYLFMGHTYQYHTPGDKVDSRIEKMDLGTYDGIWLGGDVCSESLMSYSTLAYIDSIFDLKKQTTMWALGNHDTRNGNWVWLEEITGKKTYYTTHYKGITYIVLNTNLTPYDCEQLNDQYKIIVDVCDSIKNSSHLVLLMHHGIWAGVPGLPPPSTYAQSNLVYYNFNCYSEGSTFVNEIYPRLVEVKNRGIEVLCILGDMGAKKIDIESDDGIHFLGTGLSRSYYTDPEERKKAAPDWAIVFKHVPTNSWLEWEFVDFDEFTGYTYE